MNEQNKPGYNVVFEGVGGKKSNVKGVRTWTAFNDKDDLNQWLNETQIRDRVVAEGVTEEIAQVLCSQTPATALVESAIRAATVADKTDPQILELKLETIKSAYPAKIFRHRISN